MSAVQNIKDLGNRREYLGCSELAAIMGVDLYKTPLDIYNEKLGFTEPFAGNPHTERGTKLEDLAAREYTEKTGRALRRKRVALIHPDYDFLRGHIDRVVVGQDRIAEIKCPSTGSFAKIKREGVPDAWLLQLQGYLMLSGKSAGEYVIFNADRWELLSFEVEAQPELFEQIEHAAVIFWTEHVLKQVPPAPTKQDAPTIEFAKIAGEVIHRDDPEFIEAAQLFREAKQLEKDSELLIDLAKKQVKGVVGGKFGKYEGGGMRLTYFQSQGRTSFDKKTLAAMYPEIDLSQFEKRGDPFEVLKPIFASED